jgi:dihydrolipoamide dehydrogenase
MPLRSVPFDGQQIVDSWGALDFDAVPKRLGVIGAGVIGLELGSVWRRLGAEVVVLEAMEQFLWMADQAVAKEALRHFKKQGLDVRLGAKVNGAEVVVLEAMEQFLWMADQAVAKEALRHFKKQGLDVRLGAKVNGAEVGKNGVTLKYTDGKGEQTVTVDKVVVAIGRRPYTEGLLGDGTGVQLDERGFVTVDDECRVAGAGNVWAVGDVVRGPMLAHKGKDEGVMVADLIAGLHSEVNYRAVPSVIYTAPEIAWVGQTEEQVKESGRAYKVGQFPFMASGRARAMEAPAGFCKVVAATDDDEILGVHIIGAMAGELIAEAVLAMEYSASTEDLQRTMHAHPTLSEALHEAALGADKRAIDFPNR